MLEGMFGAKVRRVDGALGATLECSTDGYLLFLRVRIFFMGGLGNEDIMHRTWYMVRKYGACGKEEKRLLLHDLQRSTPRFSLVGDEKNIDRVRLASREVSF